MMKTIVFILILLACCFLQACGESDQATTQNPTDIAKLFDLGEAKSKQFLGIYAEYQNELQNVSHELAGLNDKFINKQSNNELSEQGMINILAEYFRIDSKRSQIKQNYLQRFEEVLSKQDVFRLYQIDNNLEYIE